MFSNIVTKGKLAPVYLSQIFNNTFNGTDDFSIGTQIDEVGYGLYNTVYKAAFFMCCLSLLAIIVCRFIFRIASPREDAKAKSYIQSILVTVFILSMLMTLFGVAVRLGNSIT